MVKSMHSIAYIARKVAMQGYRPRTDIDELAAVGYLSMVEVAPRFRGDEEQTFHAFARVTAQNAMIDYLRRQQHRTVAYELTEEIAGPGKLPEEEAHERELVQRVQDILPKLSFSERAVMQCLYQEGLNQGETAQVMRLSGHGVITHRDRALRKIRRGLQGISLQ